MVSGQSGTLVGQGSAIIVIADTDHLPRPSAGPVWKYPLDDPRASVYIWAVARLSWGLVAARYTCLFTLLGWSPNMYKIGLLYHKVVIDFVPFCNTSLFWARTQLLDS